jgi:hypothetical protein
MSQYPAQARAQIHKSTNLQTSKPPVFLRGLVWCGECNMYLRADYVIYWAVDPGRPRCPNCESIVH